MLMKQYVQHMETITELKLHPTQTEKLKEALRSTKFEKLSKEAADAHRDIFDKVTADLRREWETHTGQKWPVYDQNYPSADGTRLLRRAGQPYDAHHIIQSNHAGPNEWWNLQPMHFLEEHTKIHGSGAPAREIFVGSKKGSE